MSSALNSMARRVRKYGNSENITTLGVGLDKGLGVSVGMGLVCIL